MSLKEKFQDYIQKEGLFNPGDKLIATVSGGVDSMVLAELLHQCGYSFIIAHCNFNLRPDEVEHERKLVEDAGKKYGVEVYVKEFDTAEYAKSHKHSTQVAARELRYEWFDELLKSTGCRYILTAHHAGDNIETLLMNFFRGTGIHGLRAIMPKQSSLVRPLLFANKKELEEFAAENKINFSTDSSNLSDKYSRNYLRHHLVPLISEIYPNVEENLLKNIERFRDTEILYNQSIEKCKRKLLHKKGNEVHISIPAIKSLEAGNSILYELARDYGFSSKQTPELVSLLDSGAGKYILSSTHRIINNRKWLIISAIDDSETSHVAIEKGSKKVIFKEGSLHLDLIDKGEHKLSSDAGLAQLDANDIHFPLVLRKWKAGDYFYPLGMRKKKKLNRFLIDLKLSKTEKEKTWVIEMDKKIIWVIGHRIDDRFKLTDKTKEVLRITFNV